MSDLKAIILCNNPLSLPGIKEFLFYGKVGALVTTKSNGEMQFLLQQLAEGTGVPILKVDKKNYIQEISEAIKAYNINVGLVMTFPFILPKSIIELTEKGFINFHYGLLPQCRGPQPILWHILNGDADGGITLHLMDDGIDTGPVILQEKLPIGPTDTYGILQSKLAHLGAKSAAILLKILSFGSIIPSTAQDETKAKYFKNPTSENLTISFKTMDSHQILRTINACNPWNKAAGAKLNNWVFGITEAEISNEVADNNAKIGSIAAINKEQGLLVKTKDEKLLKINIVYLQEGFFSGARLADFGIKPGDCFD
ncbi:methionyl-tRNA formyltransferase [Ferruginibacter yonginensis]|uniref:Methionyl-tRNA formyltransferase n=1 Tax=Ferruginibacter yonginensis TaxID=1310416 RepID=A0ABV8QU80_9BACT